MNPEIYENISSREDTIIAEGQTSYKIDKVESEGGLKMYLIGASFPKKGLPTAEAIWSVNLVKRTFIETVKLLNTPQIGMALIAFILLPKRRFMQKTIDSFNRLSQGALAPYILKCEYMTPIGQELRVMISMFLKSMGINESGSIQAGTLLSHLIEYDSAYRYRLEDILSETSSSNLSKRPLRETWRLWKIMEKRETNPFVSVKLRKFAILACILLLSPKIRKSFRLALKDSNFNKMQLDEIDRYWCMIREDYDFMGLNQEERKDTMEMLGWKLPNSYPIE